MELQLTETVFLTIILKLYNHWKKLNLDDYFFNLGIRIQKKLVKDLYCAPIVLANGQKNDTQYIPYPCAYNPLSEPENFVIGKDLGPVLFFNLQAQ